MAGTTPQVKQNICTDPSKPLYPAIEVGSDFWFSWLREPDVKSFHFESDRGKFTARKEERATSTNEYWYAYRKIQGKLRKVYLGAMDEITSDRLDEVAAEISQPGWEYYSTRKSYTIKKEQDCVTNNNGSTLTSPAKSYPTENKKSCVTDSSELETLRLEVGQLRSQLEQVKQKHEILQVDKERTDNVLGKLVDNIQLKHKGYTANSFSQGIKDIIQLAESKAL